MLCTNGCRIGGKVGLREYNPFGHTGGARGVHQQRGVLGCNRVRRGIGPDVGVLREAVVVRVADPQCDGTGNGGKYPAYRVCPFRAGNHQCAIRVVQHIAHLRFAAEQVHRVHTPAAMHSTKQQLQGA